MLPPASGPILTFASTPPAHLIIKRKFTRIIRMTRRLDDVAIYAAPAIFVVLWASGFVSGKYGLPYAAPFTFLSLRMIAVVAILTLIVFIMRPPWPDETTVRH